ncbi:flavin reductase [Algoriphagus sp. CAU 1675]|uniref:flavin reductase family protein n=1 Tax=Algoriphagus sp. CAU 1675 TaxID=3032597 RepID=UPI0023DCA0A6|nr:flavin reductase [Algoriphagus sp. CAU 1675]MDF2158465.1 flavin reductase [Algoriphagus sp. CAU 1675]
MNKYFSKEEILCSDSFFRKNLINCLSGYKSLNLIGTKNSKGLSNLALFSQVFHIGASPPLIGVLFRPHTVKRDTLENILETSSFTINQVGAAFYKKAHWTSARWEGSEFEKTGLQEEYRNGFFAPYVQGSPVGLGCSLVETQTLQVNQTVLVVASIDHIYVEEKGLRDDGSLDLNVLETVTVSGLDEYHLGNRLARLHYAKPSKEVEEI